MPEVGSDAWITAFAERAAGVAVDPVARVVVQQELTDTGARWHLVIDGGRVTVAAGEHASPDVWFAQDAATATAVADGTLSAQQAFMDGRLRVRGELTRLPAAAGALAALGTTE